MTKFGLAPTATARMHMPVQAVPAPRIPMRCRAAQVVADHQRYLQQHVLPHHPSVELCTDIDAAYDEYLDLWFRSFAAEPQNPMFRWIVHDPALGAEEQDARFREQLRWMLDFVDRPYKSRGIFLAVRDGGGRLVAAASLLPPGVEADPMSLRNFVAVGLPPCARRAFQWGATPLRRLDALGAMDAAKKEVRVAAGPCWHLMCLGVEPECQGKGYGGALLRATCALADAQGVPAHLECETPWHERLYAHYGFETVQRVDMRAPGDAETQPMFMMLRRPQGGAADAE